MGVASACESVVQPLPEYYNSLTSYQVTNFYTCIALAQARHAREQMCRRFLLHAVSRNY